MDLIEFHLPFYVAICFLGNQFRDKFFKFFLLNIVFLGIECIITLPYKEIEIKQLIKDIHVNATFMEKYFVVVEVVPFSYLYDFYFIILQKSGTNDSPLLLFAFIKNF